MARTKTKTKTKRKTKQKRLALIDGEILCFHLVTSSEFLREECNELDEYYNVLDMTSVKDAFTLRVDQILVETSSYGCVIFFGSKENYRKKLDPSYKAQRNKDKPLGYNALVSWVEKNNKINRLAKIEADDAMGIYHTETLDPETVLVSNDKDMKTIPGLLYDHTRPEDGIRNISEQEAAAWWGYQTLIGDSADGYKGCPGVGPVGAKPLFEKFKSSKLTGKRLQKAVFKEACAYFIEAGLTEKDALLQARLSRILRADEYNYKTHSPILWKP